MLYLFSGLGSVGLWGRRRTPVVEIMRDLMAISASREFGHDARGMLGPVAILAFRYHLVLFLMAECAGERAVFRLGRAEQRKCVLVARGAEFGWRPIRIRHDLGHMRLMALLAVLRAHISGMGLVALRAVRLFAVNAMARGAVLRRMLALVLAQLLYLRRMTGKTGFRQC